MTKMQSLKAQAMDAAKWRGHRMSRFVTHKPTLCESHCLDCNSWVQVNTRPLPNEIDLGGPAVAVGCEKP